MASVLASLFEHNLWANLVASAACRELTEEQLESSVVGTGGSIREMLMHIAGAEQRYVSRLTGEPPRYGEREGWPGVAALEAALEHSGSALLALARRSDEIGMVSWEFEGRRVEYLGAMLFVQAINHATEHRSQIATILTQQGVEPPDMSGWRWFEATQG